MAGTGSAWGRAATGAILALGCTGERAVERAHWRVAVGGATLGADEHARAPADGGVTLRSSREYAFLADGEEVRFNAESTWRLDARGRVLAYARDGGEVSFSVDTAPWAWTAPAPLGVVDVFDPATLGLRHGEVRADGARRVLDGAGAGWWLELDEAGAVRAYGEGAIAITREPGPIPPWEPVDPAHALGWPVDGPGPLADAKVLRLRVDGVDPSWLERAPRQRVEADGVLRIDAPLRAELPGAPLADAPALARAPRALIDGVPRHDRRVAIEVLVDRVRERLAYAPSPGGAWRSAFGVRGDCTEHAQLLADGALALGLPARVVTGWVYREEDGFRGFVPHAWAEVDLGAPAGWVGVDPTLGQPIADAAHVALGPAWEERPWEALAAAAEGRARVVEAR